MAAQTPSQAAWNKKNIARRREWNARWIRENRARYNASKAKYRRKLKLEGLRLYADPIQCQVCGFSEIDALVIDHISNNGAAHRKAEKIGCRGNASGTTIYELLRRKGKIEGLQVLCANCNLIKEVRRKRADHASL